VFGWCGQREGVQAGADPVEWHAAGGVGVVAGVGAHGGVEDVAEVVGVHARTGSGDPSGQLGDPVLAGRAGVVAVRAAVVERSDE
jgi:hypothetical protein